MKHYIDYSKEFYSDQLFISYNNHNITFSDFYHNVSSKSRALLRLNISDDNIVGIFLSNPIDILEVYFACIQINKQPIIFPYDINNYELQKIKNHYDIKFIITEWFQKKQIEKVDGSSFFYIQELSSSFGGCGPVEFNSVLADANEVQSLHLTSGSTGVPKLIKLTFNNFINSVSQWHKEINFSNKDRYIQCLPLNHIAGLSIIIRSQIKGFESILMKKFNASQINYEIDNGATLISLVPSMFKRLIDERQGRPFPKHLKSIIVGGDDCSNNLMLYALKNRIPVYKTYGMTETCSGVSGFWISEYPEMLDSVGKSFKKNKIEICDSKICITGPTVSPYLNSKDNKLDSFITSDTGFIENRFLFLTGRCDDIVIKGGENISLSKIKNVLFKHKYITDVYMETENDDNIGTKIDVFIEVSKNNISVEDIYDYLLKYIPQHQCPIIIQIVDKIHHN